LLLAEFWFSLLYSWMAGYNCIPCVWYCLSRCAVLFRLLVICEETLFRLFRRLWIQRKIVFCNGWLLAWPFEINAMSGFLNVFPHDLKFFPSSSLFLICLLEIIFVSFRSLFCIVMASWLLHIHFYWIFFTFPLLEVDGSYWHSYYPFFTILTCEFRRYIFIRFMLTNQHL
jgi:hypothetical protein